MSKLKDLCDSYQASGLYTHVYAACGFLSGSDNTFEYSNLPDGRDVFDLSSLTKALVTTPLVLWRCRSKVLPPRETKVSVVFGPEALAKIGAKSHDLLVSDYLRHDTGLPAWRNFYVTCENKSQTLSEVLNGLITHSGSKEIYSDIGFLVLGELLQTTSGQSLLHEWREKCKSAGIRPLNFLASGGEFPVKKAISTGFCPVRRRELCGEVHDENCWALGGYTGHAGLFGTGSAVAKYLRDLWHTDSGRLVYDANFEEKDSPGESLMGWRKGRDQSAATFAGGRGCGHLGFTGTAFWVDPETQSYALVLTNRIISARVSPGIKIFRADAFRELWKILEESK